MRVAVLAVGLAACSAPLLKHPPPTTKTAVEDKVDPVGAAAELRVSILDSYRLLSQGYENVYLESVAPDPKVMLIGVEPGDLLVGQSRLAAQQKALFPGLPYELVSKNLEVQVAADGTCAWAHDDLGYRVVRDGRRASFPLRATSLYERRDGRWLKVFEHVSYAVPADQVAALPAAAPAPLPPSIPEGEAAARAREVVLALATRSSVKPTVGETAVVISSDGRERRGPAAADLLTLPAQFGGDAIEVKSLRVELSRTGTVAWAAAEIEVRGAAGTHSARATWVLEKQGGELRPVQVHVSFGVPGEYLAATVFGDEQPAAR